MDINFKTGLLKVTEDSISLKWPGNNVSMFRWQIGKVDIQTSKELDKNVWVYGFRLGAIGLILVIFGLIINKGGLLIFGNISLWTGLAIIFGDIFLDGMLGLNFVNAILFNLIGKEYTKVTIQNTSGKDIEFYILPEEKTKARSIDKLRIEKQEVVNSSITQSNNSDSISDIEKLYFLKEKGIITPEEFEKKKSKILGI